MTKSEADRQRECRTEVLEALVALYLRLNGYFCITNYLYHRTKEDAEGLRAESDLLALRVPHQVERLEDGTEQANDTTLILPTSDGRIDCLIAEVKERTIEFNRPVCKPEGWKIIADAVRMFGVLPAKEFDNDGSGTIIARALHSQITAPGWKQLPAAGDGEKGRVCLRMPVFAPNTAKHARDRKFISLEHCLEFVRLRMRPGQACSAYYRGLKFSPWRGTTRRIVNFLDESCGKRQTPTVELLLGRLCV